MFKRIASGEREGRTYIFVNDKNEAGILKYKHVRRTSYHTHKKGVPVARILKETLSHALIKRKSNFPPI
jgi:hypothetical protein